MTVPEKLFKATLNLAKFTNLNMLDIRKTEFDEIVYLYNGLVGYDFGDMIDNNAVPGVTASTKGVRRKVYADQVDWFD